VFFIVPLFLSVSLGLSAIDTGLRCGVPFLSDADLEPALDDAGVPDEAASAILEENSKARLRALRGALAVIAIGPGPVLLQWHPDATTRISGRRRPARATASRRSPDLSTPPGLRGSSAAAGAILARSCSSPDSAARSTPARSRRAARRS
jgi:hypothetical protein